MVIGRPWEDPQRRPDIGADLIGAPPAPDDDAHEGEVETAAGGRSKLERQDAEELRIGPAGIDDPDTAWEIAETATAELPELYEDEIWLLTPGEELMIVTTLPKPRHLYMGIAVRPGEIAVCAGRQRSWCRTPIGASEENEDLPMAHTLYVVFIRHRAKGVKTKPRKYLIVTDEDDTPLGWLDYSDGWNFDGGVIKRMIDAAGLAYKVERFDNEPQFVQAHPSWNS